MTKESESAILQPGGFSARKTLVAILDKLGFKTPARISVDVFKISLGFFAHWWRGTTPNSAHRTMVELFCDTDGRANDAMSWVISKVHPPYHFPHSNGLLGQLDDSKLRDINRELDQKGYYVFDNRLPADVCDRIAEKTLTVDCLVRGDNLAKANSPAVYAKFDPANALGAVYVVPGQFVTEIPEIQDLLRDFSLLSIAQNYLRAKPIITQVNMAWSGPSGSPDKEAAQLFHFDMERIKWLRYFVYLTDVDEDCGPHCFIEGSHLTGTIPKEFLRQGYARLTDEDVFKRYDKSRHKTFLGKKGTIIAEDSRGLHKGRNPVKGSRLLLDFEISTSTFGAVKRRKMEKFHSPELRKMFEEYPRIYSNFDF
ncbi:MAG: phytanoyl-CoA dioxygenase family protein, partial [Bdellovibrionota bacterium]